MSEFPAPPSSPRLVPTLDFSIIGETWDCFRRNVKPFLIAGAVYWVASAVVTGLSLAGLMGVVFAVLERSQGNVFALLAAVFLNPFYWFIIFFASVSSIFIQGAFAGMVLQEFRGETPSLNGAWEAVRRNMGALFLMGLAYFGMQVVSSFISIFGLVILFIATALYVAVPAIVDKNMSMIEAFKFSYEKVKPVYWMTLGLYIVCSLLTIAGIFACGIGTIVSMIFITVAPTLAYLKVKDSGGMVFFGDSPYAREASSMSGVSTVTEVPRQAPPVADKPVPSDFAAGSEEAPPQP